LEEPAPALKKEPEKFVYRVEWCKLLIHIGFLPVAFSWFL
jgi:hypothetical protein